MDFPYLQLYYTNEERINIFKKLSYLNVERGKFIEKTISKNKFHLKYDSINLPLENFLYKGEYKFIIYPDNYYLEYGLLSSTFLDKCKAVCKFSKYDSPYDYYMKNRDREEYKGKTGIDLREAIYFSLKYECSNHNPAIISYFIKLFNAKRILDPAGGWGDRLLGALSCDIDLYLNVDPNPCLHPFYREMINVLLPYSPNPKMDVITMKGAFEKVQLGRKIKESSIDLVYTSPPYFDYEVYTGEKGQSIIDNTTEDKWISNFLIPFLKKCLKFLKKEGHMVLYFSQEKGSTYIEKMFQYILENKKFEYLGCYWYASEKLRGLHPIFIWKKL
jgi:hypothetical protein